MKFVKSLISMSLALFILAGTMAGCNKKNEVTTSSSSNPVPIKIFANFSSESETVVDKAWQANVEKALNITINWEVPPSSGYTDRLQVMLAGGSYPDVVYFSDPTAKVFTDAVNNGVVIPITE